MNPFGVLARREASQLLCSTHGLGPLLLALAGASGLFVLLLRHEEGHVAQLPALWGLATAFGLPFLAAVAASRGFTRDRENGMMRLMFSTPVRTRWWVLGKVFGAWSLSLIYVLGMMLSAWVFVRWLAPQHAQMPWTWLGFLFAILALLIESILWCSIGTLASLFSRSSASTFLLSLLISLFAPPMVSMLLVAVMPNTVTQWPWFPLQSVVYDCATGLIHVRALLGCIIASGVVVYLAGILFDSLRMLGAER
jgi:ABC-type transport system involved in multi-copper enzyme maturation permease subunit